MAGYISFIFMVFTLPACILALVFGFKMDKGIKYLFISLATAIIIALIVDFSLEVGGEIDGPVIGVLSLVLSIPNMCVCIHMYKKYNLPIEKEVEPTTSNTNLLGSEVCKNKSYIDEIKGLKMLLDEGAITQEEYDKKKTEILNR